MLALDFAQCLSVGTIPMREARLDCCLVLICASLAVGCNSKPSVVCPAIDVFEADPSKIPPGESTSIITTLASDPQAAGDPDGGRSIATILTLSLIHI